MYRFLGPEGDVSDIILTDTQGTVLLAALNTENVGVDISAKKWYGTLASPVTYEEALQENVIGITLPIVSQVGAGDLLGSLTLLLKMQSVSELLSNRAEFRDSATYETYIVDNRDLMVTDSRFASDAPLKQSVQTAAVILGRTLKDAEVNFADRYINYRGREVFGAVANDRNLGWVVVSEVEEDDILRPVNVLLQSFIGIIVISLTVIIVFAVLLASQLARPLNSLTRSAAAVARGDLAQNVNITQRGEVGLLANAFNQMTKELGASYATLERRVEERTAQLAEAQQQAERASQAKSMFLSNMSHELRTPLNVIIGYSSSMLSMPHMYDETQLAPVFEPDMRLILGIGKYLLGLINDILDLSKIEAGRLELKRSPTDLVEVFRGVIATSVGLVGTKAVQIRPDFPQQLPKVEIDQQRVRQIILNLMSNAIKFTELDRVVRLALPYPWLLVRPRLSQSPRPTSSAQTLRSLKPPTSRTNWNWLRSRPSCWAKTTRRCVVRYTRPLKLLALS